MRKFLLLVAAALAFAPIASAQERQSEFRQWNVCVQPEQGSYTFSSQTPVDFMLVDIFREETFVARLYLGNYPNIGRDELAQARSARRTGLFAPLTARTNQHVSFPEVSRQPIIHLMFAPDAPADAQQIIIRSIRYCDAQ